MLLSLPTISVYNSINAANTCEQELTEEEIEIIEATIKAVRENKPFFKELARNDLTDEQIQDFTKRTFDQFQIAVTRDACVEIARFMHTSIQVLGYNKHVPTIVHNLRRIAEVSTNKHVAALTAYLEENNIDLSNPNACIE